MRIIDLSRPIQNGMTPPSERDVGYRDPQVLVCKQEVYIEDWVTLDNKDYFVSRIIMGAHSGTHCDVQLHYQNAKTPDGKDKSVDTYKLNTWIGRVLKIENKVKLGSSSIITKEMIEKLDRNFKEGITIPVFIYNQSTKLSDEARSHIINKWKPKVVVMGEGTNQNGYDDTVAFLGADIPMIMYADHSQLLKLENGDLIIGMPLKLVNTEAAPMRLIAIQGLNIDDDETIDVEEET